MPTPTGLPKVGEIWTLTRRIPGQPVQPIRVVIIERSQGSYWSLRVGYIKERDGHKYWHRALWVDATYLKQQGWLKFTGQEAGPKTKRALGIG